MKMCVSLDMAIYPGAPQKTHIGVIRVRRVIGGSMWIQNASKMAEISASLHFTDF